ncbi:MAG: DoxX family protein [Candidatus Acidiferrum sp.]
MLDLTISLQALVAVSIFFVWVVRYHNVVEEFRHYRLPDWLRDLVGVLKLTFALLLLLGIERAPLAIAGSLGIAFLMICAFLTHLRVKNPFFKMLPSLTLLVVSLVIAFINYRLLNVTW